MSDWGLYRKESHIISMIRDALEFLDRHTEIRWEIHDDTEETGVGAGLPWKGIRFYSPDGDTIAKITERGYL